MPIKSIDLIQPTLLPGMNCYSILI